MSELLFPAPDRWEVTTLGNVCAAGGGSIQTGPFGSQLHASDYVSSGTPSVMPQNIGDNIIDEDGIARIRDADVNRLSKFLFKEGDIVYSRRGDVTRRALIRREQQGWLCGTGCLRVRIGSEAIPQFVSYYLGHPRVREWITRHAVGATMLNLNTKILSALPVVLPPHSEQYAIAGLLGALDNKIAVNDRITFTCIETASTLLQYELNAAKTTDITLKEAASWLSGGTPKTSEPTYWSGEIPWISAASLKSFLVGDSDRRLTAVGASSGTKVVPAGTTICVVRGMSLKTEFRMGITMREVAFGQDCKAFVPRGDITPHVLAYSLWNNRTNVLKLVDEAGHGTGRLDSELLGSVRLTIPEKHRMGQLEQRLEKLTCLGEMQREESEKLGRLRDSLLPKLMSGQVRIRDAERLVEDAV